MFKQSLIDFCLILHMFDKNRFDTSFLTVWLKLYLFRLFYISEKIRQPRCSVTFVTHQCKTWYRRVNVQHSNRLCFNCSFLSTVPFFVNKTAGCIFELCFCVICYALCILYLETAQKPTRLGPYQRCRLQIVGLPTSYIYCVAWL